MRFVHIIEINDPRNPLLDVLTRDQLWRGLMRRAECPTEFLPQLANCHIVMRGGSTLARELDFGAFTVRDRVRLIPHRQMTFETETSAQVPAGRLSIEIESNGDEHLQLRFTYDIQHEPDKDAAMTARYEQALKSAYLQADIECVRIIRRLIANAEL